MKPVWGTAGLIPWNQILSSSHHQQSRPSLLASLRVFASWTTWANLVNRRRESVSICNQGGFQSIHSLNENFHWFFLKPSLFRGDLFNSLQWCYGLVNVNNLLQFRKDLDSTCRPERRLIFTKMSPIKAELLCSRPKTLYYGQKVPQWIKMSDQLRIYYAVRCKVLY